MGPRADIGVFGGSGFYSFLTGVEEVKIETPYGAPSGRLAIASIGDKRVAFLPRHGSDHSIPPHMIDYRANLWAMKVLGVTRLLGPCAAGSLQPNVKPGDFVISDQFVNRTYGRRDTFYDGPVVTHIGGSEPYCPQLRALAIEKAKELGIVVHERGTVVVIQGPRFSSKAESREFSSHGWEVINMTQYPECVLARELDLCYANIALITDYDAGLEGRPDVPAVTHEAVLAVFSQNIERLRSLLFRVIEDMPSGRECACGETVSHSRMG
jgi:5'-methylthioadenosine phosphorylase